MRRGPPGDSLVAMSGRPGEAAATVPARVGPPLRVRALAGADGRWTALRGELRALFGPLAAAEYLLVLGRRPGPEDKEKR